MRCRRERGGREAGSHGENHLTRAKRHPRFIDAQSHEVHHDERTDHHQDRRDNRPETADRSRCEHSRESGHERWTQRERKVCNRRTPCSAQQTKFQHAGRATDHLIAQAPDERDKNRQADRGRPGQSPERVGRNQRIQRERDATDGCEDCADERIEGCRPGQRCSGYPVSGRAPAAAGRIDNCKRDEAQDVRHRMLRHPPEAAWNAVDAQSAEPPVADRVDVEVPDGAEGRTALHQAQ